MSARPESHFPCLGIRFEKNSVLPLHTFARNTPQSTIYFQPSVPAQHNLPFSDLVQDFLVIDVGMKYHFSTDGIMKNDAHRISFTTVQFAHSMLHVHPIISLCTFYGSKVSGEEYHIPFLGPEHNGL